MFSRTKTAGKVCGSDYLNQAFSVWVCRRFYRDFAEEFLEG
jgi:hypothetical protein